VANGAARARARHDARADRPSVGSGHAAGAALDDDDIKALFAYLQSLPSSKNKVPQPIDPPEGQR
jgi:cytochrome c553